MRRVARARARARTVRAAGTGRRQGGRWCESGFYASNEGPFTKLTKLGYLSDARLLTSSYPLALKRCETAASRKPAYQSAWLQHPAETMTTFSA